MALVRFGLDFLRVGDARYSGLTPVHNTVRSCCCSVGMWVLVTLHPVYAVHAVIRRRSGMRLIPHTSLVVLLCLGLMNAVPVFA